MVKNPESRATASQLLNHEFIVENKQVGILSEMINEANTLRETQKNNHDDGMQVSIIFFAGL